MLPIGDGSFARVGISIGAASYPNGGTTLDQIIISADKAMYGVKSLRKRAKEQHAEKAQSAAAAAPPAPPVQPKPIPIRPIEPKQEIPIESKPESFVVELDESHIISSAIN